jgi:4-diphosphocytidyl-2-C-methyl-D-erythritol kinase
MVSFPPCKINLGLQIINKRSDGYHDLLTCFYPLPWTDILEIMHADSFAFTCSGNHIPGPAEANLCIKAYELLQRNFDLSPVKIHLHKIIPTGAGLGGGSADAAYTLRLLNDLFRLQLSQQTLMDYAAKLGSDCAFFIQDNPMFGKGRGEILTKIAVDLRGKYLMLVKPDIHVSTAEAFAGIRPQQPQQALQEVLRLPTADWKLILKNDFEDTVFGKHPSIQLIKEKLYSIGAEYASMSGTGSAVFGIFDAEVELENHFPHTTVWAGFMQ